MSCGTIDRGSQAECDELIVAGTRARLILINYEDVLFIAEDEGKITAIELKSGKQAYEFLGFRSDVKKSEDVVRTNLKNRFKHFVNFIVYEVDPTQKINVRRIVKGRFLAIVESKGKTDDSIEVVGKSCGLAIVGSQIRGEDGIFTINLATTDNPGEFERKLPQTLGTSYSNGLEIIDGLLEEPEVSLAFDYDLDFDL